MATTASERPSRRAIPAIRAIGWAAGFLALAGLAALGAAGWVAEGERLWIAMAEGAWATCF